MSTFNFSGTNCQPLLLNRLSILLLVIAVGCSQPESPQATGVSPEPSKPIAAKSPKPPTSVKALSAPASFPQSDPFPEVIDTAMDAATITQSAVSPDDWKLVVSKWQQAIALLKTVPPSHPKKALAQQKIGEYQRNLAYAKQQAVRSFRSTASPISSSLTNAGNTLYVRFPAVGIRLLKPQGFQEADSFHGFSQPSTKSSVMATMLPAPFSEITADFTAERMGARGMILLSKETVNIDGQQGILLQVMQKAYGIEFQKWILVIGDSGKTIMIIATFPKSLEAQLSSRLKSVVMSAKLDQGTPPAPGDDLPFTVTASPKLRLTTQGISKLLMYTKDGVIPVKSPEDPLFLVAPSLSQVAIMDKRAFAEQRLSQTAETKLTAIKSTRPISIDGLSGYESLADAEDVNSGTPLTFYQVMLFDENSYILMQGLVGAKLSNTYMPEFVAMARSLKRKQR